ncbi:MAG TPA: hypothetical protein VLB67_05120 [Acidimicrobiia bacterium]|nr:hypothetical protein [Acidimicrobiia bacterium]
MSEPTERQVLYGLVAAAWFAVVGVLAGVSASVGLSPVWWTAGFAIVWLAALVAGARTWRRTGRLLLLSSGVFIVWAVGTLLTR